jgi:hypothetical protein
MRATERNAGEKNGGTRGLKDQRTVEVKERACKKIRDARKLIEAKTARMLRDNDIIAEEELAEDKLRAEECYRRKCATLERKIKKTGHGAHSIAEGSQRARCRQPSPESPRAPS